MPKTDSFQEKMFMMMKEMTGASDNIAVSRLFCKAMGGLTGGVFLSQLVYWCDKGVREDGYIYKTNEEWEEETYLSKYEVTKARKILEDAGVLETMVKKVSGNPTLHYKLLRESFVDWLVKFFTNQNEKLEEGKSNVSLSITESTSKITAKNTTTELPAKPIVVVAPILKNTERDEPVIVELAVDLLPRGISQKLVNKLTVVHGAESVNQQIKNLIAEQSKRTVKNPAGWLTVAVNEGFDSKTEADLFAVQENKKLEQDLIAVSERESMSSVGVVQDVDFMAFVKKLPIASQYAKC